MSDEPFTTTMRKATRKAHAVSDALVNAKLLMALNNEKVWGEGLLVFYEIFKFLEAAMRQKLTDNLAKLFNEDMMRTWAFETDLTHYLGPNWRKNYTIRESVRNYLEHLDHLSKTEPDLLMAYIYHLYMGLLSGGQILQKKRDLKRKLLNRDEAQSGVEVTSFKDVTISDLKSHLRSTMNSIAETLDNDKKASLVVESVKVFELNNSIIRTVEGADSVALKNLLFIASVSLVFVLLGFYYYKKVFS